jgi:NADPH-dependent curcumin reductase CurA
VKGVVPDGIDMYFENVGGMHFEAALATLRHKGRIAVCGAIAKYNDVPGEGAAIPEKLNIGQMIYAMQRIEGFTCMPYLTGQIGSFHTDMWKWHQEGKINVEETVTEGIENWPLAFKSLFEGTNSGKVVVKVN